MPRSLSPANYYWLWGTLSQRKLQARALLVNNRRVLIPQHTQAIVLSKHTS